MTKMKQIFYKIYLFSVFSLAAILLLLFCPIVISFKETKAAIDAPILSETELNVELDGKINLNLDPSQNGGYNSSNELNVNVTTNHYTGYSLSIAAKDSTEDNTSIINIDNPDYKIESIETAIEKTDYISASNNMNTWGYTPSMLNSEQNTKLQPAPTAEGVNLATTEEANAEVDTYKISVDAKVDTNQISGDYEQQFVFIAVPNPIAYLIQYDKNTEDYIYNVPAAQANTESDFMIKLSENTLTRTGYNFGGWCDGESENGECDGTIYNAGDEYYFDQTADNNITLKAVWELLPTPKGILGANGNVNFVYDTKTYTIGEIYEDNLGETEIVAVYPADKVNKYDKWAGEGGYWPNYRSDVTSANFDESFYDYKPTDVSGWFYNNGYISSVTNLQNFDTSKATVMSGVFMNLGHEVGVAPITDFTSIDTSSATTFANIFCGYATGVDEELELDVTGWDTSKVTTLQGAFSYTGENSKKVIFKGLGDWDVSAVESMYLTFSYYGNNSDEVYLDLSNWHTPSLTSTNNMFYETARYGGKFIVDVSGLDMGNVTDVYGMFYDAGNGVSEEWRIDGITNWDIHSLTSLNSMFYGAGSRSAPHVYLDLSGWDVSRITNMSYMFASFGGSSTYIDGGDQDTRLNIENWDTSSLENMDSMFSGMGANSNDVTFYGLESLNTSNVTNMKGLFYKIADHDDDFGIGIPWWDTRKVTNMDSMFYMVCESSKVRCEINISGWNNESLTSAKTMFQNLGHYADADIKIDVSGSNNPKLTNASGIFGAVGRRTSGTTLIDVTDISVPSLTNIESGFYQFCGGSSCEIAGIDSVDLSSVTNLGWLFTYSMGSTTESVNWDLRNWHIGGNVNINSAFSNFAMRAQSFYMNVSGWDVSNVTSFGALFNNAALNATTWDIVGLETWDTSNVTDMSSTFSGACGNATSCTLNVAGWNTGNVTNMNRMFCGAGLNVVDQTLDLSGWNVDKITDAYYHDVFRSYADSDFIIEPLWNV